MDVILRKRAGQNDINEYLLGVWIATLLIVPVAIVELDKGEAPAHVGHVHLADALLDGAHDVWVGAREDLRRRVKLR